MVAVLTVKATATHETSRPFTTVTMTGRPTSRDAVAAGHQHEAEHDERGAAGQSRSTSR